MGLYLRCLYSRGLGLYSGSYIYLAGHIFLEVNLYSSDLIFFWVGLYLGGGCEFRWVLYLEGLFSRGGAYIKG